ncbi:MAG: 16S rRNA (adenine(1518)-N(6)/adenine(1519)-N(6))-dimethyltransferase RsmA [Bacteroidota bacterium]
MDNLKPKKHLGQHFLKEPTVAQRIANSLKARPEQQVVEIGPGQGVLTDLLWPQYPHLQLVEVDPEAVAWLSQHYGENGPRIVHQDILKWKPQDHLQPDAAFIGNLPYNISSPIFFTLLDNLEYVQQGVFMIQKEVAERICANEGSKTYGILSVLLGAYFERSYEFSVPPHVFRPPPKVQSGVIRLVRKEALPTVAFSKLKRLVKAAFNQRRKTLRNALKSVPMQEFPDQEVILKLRAEQLPIEKFVELANYME